MWIYVFLGNILRGIGETPVQPLGISYIDDHALEENAAFYIGTYNANLFLCIFLCMLMFQPNQTNMPACLYAVNNNLKSCRRIIISHVNEWRFRANVL